MVTPGQFQFSDTNTLPKALKSFLGASPTFLAELDDVLGGETAVYVRSGLPIPEVTIVTQPNDTKVAEQSLEDVLKTLRAKDIAVGGLKLSSIAVVHDVVGGQLVISTSQQGIADFRSNGPKLSSDPSFTSAVKASGMPSQTTGFLYANLATAVPLVQMFGPALGLTLPPAVAKTDFSAAKSLTAYGTRAGEESTFSVFLEVR
jgi:hypothetical protein